MIIKPDVVKKQNYLFLRSKFLRYCKKSICVLVLVSILTGCGEQPVNINNTITKNKEELKWSWVINAEEYEEIYFVNDTMVALKNDAGKWGIIDLTNDKVIALFLYDDVSIFHNNFIRLKKDDNIYFMNTMGVFLDKCQFQDARDFSESMAAVEKDQLWGYIDNLGTVKIDYRYTEAASFSEGLAAVKINDKWGYIDREGKQVIDFIYNEALPFCEGRAIVKMDEKYGVINEYGKIIADFEYDEIRNYKESYAAVLKKGKWGFINESGQCCIPCEYDKVEDFSEGYAAVEKNFEGKGEQWAYIDEQGQVKINFYPYQATEGRRVYVGEFQNGIAFVSKDLYCIIDKTGKLIFSGDSNFFISALSYNEEYNIIPGYVYVDDRMTIKKNGLMGLHGEQRLEPTFDYIHQMKGQYIVVAEIINGDYREGVIKIE